jgi:tape measure domain-containing protein
MVVRELVNKIGFEVDEAGMKRAEGKTRNLSKIMKRAIFGVTAAVAAIGIFAVKAAGDMEMLRTQFEVMLGNAEEARDLMEELKQFAAATPFAIQDLAQGTQQLLSFGVAQEDVLETMRMLGDTSGGNREKLSALVLAFGKVQAKGKASMEEINMLAERGVPIIATLRDQLGLTEQEFFKLVSAGKIGRKEIRNAFKAMTSEGGMFFEGMKKQSLTFQGLVSTMLDNLKLLAASVGEEILPVVKDLIKLIIELVQGPIGDLVRSIVVGLKPVLEIVKGLIDTIFTALAPLSGIIETVFQLVARVLGLLKVLGPIMKLVTAVLSIIDKVLKAVTPALNTVIDLVTELAEVLAEALSEELIETLEPLGETLVMVAEVLSVILKLLNPILRIMTRIFAGVLVRRIRLFFLPLRVAAKVFTVLFDKISKLVNLLQNMLQPTFDAIAASFEKVFTKISEVFDTMYGWIIERIQGLIDWMNKIPGVQIKLPALEEQTGKAIQQQINNNQRLTNIRMQNQINMNMGAGAPGIGLTGDQARGAMAAAARAAFSLELRKVLISAI